MDSHGEFHSSAIHSLLSGKGKEKSKLEKIYHIDLFLQWRKVFESQPIMRLQLKMLRRDESLPTGDMFGREQHAC